MSKILKPYTIIPNDLYVQRDADRQVKNIINDMGRPGYVLVSRQMGKTNLLLNAKRKLETPNDVFVYIDLSNPFENAKSCFENIIDIAIETNLDKFQGASKTIFDRRKHLTDTPAHKQHTNELRILLNAVEGKLVIILDEIDALTKTQYSDQIFAQIRSIYFSRVNYKELEKLTYLLSGVIEPTEIIKDPKISPFNIGQKIFLNDFNREEFEQLLTNSNLILSQEIRDKIFYWTNGNPRMTWDVCSEVENNLKSQEITISLIDKIVSEIYLTTFDKPPIDNIRELVKKDREIRDSIVEIEYKKGKEISDKIKNKLYLSGIINYNENDIHIKNEIIRQALNLDWIKSLEEEDKGLIRVATEQFDKHDYIGALKTFEKFISNNEFEDSTKSLCYYYMGFAAYRNSDFPKALHYLNKTDFDIEEDRKLHYRTLNLKGLIYYYQNKIDDSLSAFKLIMESEKRDKIYVSALLNFGSVSLKSEKINYKNEAIKIFEEIINERGFSTEKLKEEFVKELKSIAHYNLAQIQKTNGEIHEAIHNYKQAILLGKANTIPAISLALFDISNSEEEKFTLFSELINLITSGNIKPTENEIERPIEFSFDEFRNVILIAFSKYNDSLFPKLIPYLSFLGNRSLSKHYYDLAIFSINKNKDWDTGIKILRYLSIENEDTEIDNITKYGILKLLAFSTPTQEGIQRHIEYINFFQVERLELVDYLDMSIFSNLIYALLQSKKFGDGLKYINLINSIKNEVSEDNLINYVLISHLELNIYWQLNDRIISEQKARELLELANNEIVKNQTSDLLGETGVDIAKENANAILQIISGIQKPIISNKIYGRNSIIKVRYKDGTTLETKYKKVYEDINVGNCFILD